METFTQKTESEAVKVPSLNPSSVAIIEEHGGKIEPLNPVGAAVSGIDLAAGPPPAAVVKALEESMGYRGFLVFQSAKPLSVEHFLDASRWWGGRELHSTHGVHPATPGGNRDIFRLSNDPQHGIPGVGPQWHNDGSFVAATFSHAGYHIVRPAEKGGGTSFAHQGAAFASLPRERQEYWSRLSSVNSASGVVHPAVHRHPVSGLKSIWLHLGMTGAVVEKLAAEEGFRLLDADELRALCHEYNDLLTAGFDRGYAIDYEYQRNDCVFVDNLAVAHRASPRAHLPAEEQGLRIMHRSTVRGVGEFAPDFGLPGYLDLQRPNPFDDPDGVWQAGGVGFRWDDSLPMQN